MATKYRMLGLKIFVWVLTFQWTPFLPLRNFCHPASLEEICLCVFSRKAFCREQYCRRTESRSQNNSFSPVENNISHVAPAKMVFSSRLVQWLISWLWHKVNTHITENPPRHLVHIVFWSGIGQNVQKWQYLAQNDQICIFWTKFGRFWAKNPNFYGSK